MVEAKRVCAAMNPLCKKCKYCANLGTSYLKYCSYVTDTGIIPGYVDDKGVYHRDTYPECKEFEAGKVLRRFDEIMCKTELLPVAE